MHARKCYWDYFWYAKYFLQAAGILPLGGTPSLWKSVLTEILAISPLFYGCYLLVLQIDYILWQSHNDEDLFDSMTVVVGVLGLQFRAIFVTIHRRKITDLFSICERLWNNAILADYEVISIWVQWARRFSTIHISVGQFAISSFTVTALVKRFSSPANSTIRLYPFQFQNDFAPSPQYEIAYTIQVLIGYLGQIYVLATDISGTLLTLNICGQLALIRSWLSAMSKEEFITGKENTDDSMKVMLKNCISRHQFVMNFCTELEEVGRYINLARVINGMYLLALSGASVTKSLQSYKYFATIILSTISLFFSCGPADSLSSACDEVSRAVYEIPWYRFSLREKRSVAIILARSQHPAKLTAGKFAVLSLETFSSVVSSAISFCMVLNSI